MARLIQVNHAIHFHMRVLDGAYLGDIEPPVFRQIPAPNELELQALVGRLVERIGRARLTFGTEARLDVQIGGID